MKREFGWCFHHSANSFSMIRSSGAVLKSLIQFVDKVRMKCHLPLCYPLYSAQYLFVAALITLSAWLSNGPFSASRTPKTVDFFLTGIFYFVTGNNFLSKNVYMILLPGDDVAEIYIKSRPVLSVSFIKLLR